MSVTRPIAMTIAGSDSSGGAGIQADLKTFSALGAYGASVITALTAQNTQGVQGVHPVPPAFILAQIDSVLSDLTVGAAKTGMLGTAAIVMAVCDRLAGDTARLPLIVDPVMVATSGDVLLAEDAIAAVKSRLIPRAELITPNLPEAAKLLGAAVAHSTAEAVEQAKALAGLGAKAVLVKGGHGSGNEAIDVLVMGGQVTELKRPRIETRNTHGTGCTLSAAITALRARGMPLEAAVRGAKDYLWAALDAGKAMHIGNGHGPVDHLYAVKPPV